jgi:hypothetical protein
MNFAPKKFNAVRAALIVFSFMLCGKAMAQAILPTLPAGSQYQIMFVTSDGPLRQAQI